MLQMALQASLGWDRSSLTSSAARSDSMVPASRSNSAAASGEASSRVISTSNGRSSTRRASEVKGSSRLLIWLASEITPWAFLLSSQKPGSVMRASSSVSFWRWVASSKKPPELREAGLQLGEGVAFQ